MIPPAPGAWLCGQLMPWWHARIVDPRGGFFESVDGAGTVVTDARRTALTQARLTYAFSHAAVLTGDAAMLRAAAHGRDFLVQRFRDVATGGWHRCVHAGSAIEDPVHDAYDHAFVLFALAWHFRATGDDASKALADATCAFMDERLRDAPRGGYVEECGDGPKPRPAWRRQNPHMHLLEAYLAWYESDPSPAWLARATAIVDLFKRHFFEPRTGTLIEFFTDDWMPAPGDTGAWREPGHHFEWVWLLHQYGRFVPDPDVAAAADRLWDFGMRHGIERDVAPRGLAFDGVDAGGRLVADTKLLWPQTELLKACTARFEHRGDHAAEAMARDVYAAMLANYFGGNRMWWVNQLARDGAIAQPAAPARILYHVFLAVAEFDRVLGAR